MAIKTNNLINLFTIIVLLLIQTSVAQSKVGEPIAIELDIPEHLEEDFEKFSDIIDMGDVNNNFTIQHY